MSKKPWLVNLLTSSLLAIILIISINFIQQGLFLKAGLPVTLEGIILFPTLLFYFMGLGILFYSHVIVEIFIFLIWTAIFYIYFLIYEKILSKTPRIVKILYYCIPVIFVATLFILSLFAYTHYSSYRANYFEQCLAGHPINVGSPHDAGSCMRDFIDIPQWLPGQTTFNIQAYKNAIDVCKAMPDKLIDANQLADWERNFVPSDTNYVDYCFANLSEEVSVSIAKTIPAAFPGENGGERYTNAFASSTVSDPVSQICKELENIRGETKYKECINYVQAIEKITIDAWSK